VPLPSDPPEWLTAARSACFGATESGLPAASGWMLLVLAPASFLGAIFALWGSEVAPSLRHAAGTPLGRCAFAVIALALVTEGVWVSRKVHAARAVATWAPATQRAGELPSDYPRQVTPAPEFALVDRHGTRISLEGLRGRPVVLTFVFAHCQTMCPLLVETIKRAAPARSEVLLVTLDPWRDTPNTLPGIARRWQVPENFHVLSSARVPDVLGVVEAYGVPFERNERSGDIVHPGLVFLIDAEGRMAYTFNNPSPGWVHEGVDRLGKRHAGTR
jgi:protein SCO1/2